MNIKYIMVSGVLSLGLSSSIALAEKLNIDMTPGLWENTFTVQAEGQIGAALNQAQKYLANLPDSERKMIESMMKDQGVPLGNNHSVVQVCISQEQIDKGQLPQNDKGCSQDVQQLSKNKFSLAFECPAAQGNAKGSGEIQFQNSKNYTGDVSFTTSLAGAAPEVVNVKQSGKWLSADCGNLKPVQ